MLRRLLDIARSRRPHLLVAALCGLVLPACSPPAPTEYAEENDEAFLAACTDFTGDELLVQRICRCVLDEARATIEFARFLEIDDALSDPETAALPDELVDIVAECTIVEGDL